MVVNVSYFTSPSEHCCSVSKHSFFSVVSEEPKKQGYTSVPCDGPTCHLSGSCDVVSGFQQDGLAASLGPEECGEGSKAQACGQVGNGVNLATRAHQITQHAMRPFHLGDKQILKMLTAQSITKIQDIKYNGYYKQELLL